MSLEENELKQLQLTELEMMIEFDRVVKLLGLKYSLSGGTLLGAIRHKGFIPWDDDVDICMLRNDYEIFLKKGPLLINDRYSIDSFHTTEDFFYWFCKITMKKSKIIYENLRDLSVLYNADRIFIDIIPVDRIPTNKIIFKIQQLLLCIASFICGSRITLKKYKNEDNNFIKNVVKHLCFFLNRIIGERNLLNFMEYIRKAGGGDTNLQFTCADAAPIKYDKKVKYDIFNNLVSIEFENNIFTAVKDYEAYLVPMYGNWYELPPEDQRISHGMKKVIYPCENKE